MKSRKGHPIPVLQHHLSLVCLTVVSFVNPLDDTFPLFPSFTSRQSTIIEKTTLEQKLSFLKPMQSYKIKELLHSGQESCHQDRPTRFSFRYTSLYSSENENFALRHLFILALSIKDFSDE